MFDDWESRIQKYKWYKYKYKFKKYILRVIIYTEIIK